MEGPQIVTSMVPDGGERQSARLSSSGSPHHRILETEESLLRPEHIEATHHDNSGGASRENGRKDTIRRDTSTAEVAATDPTSSQSKTAGNATRQMELPAFTASRRPKGAMRKWQTEANRNGQRGPAPYHPAKPKRAGTPHLNHAIWQSCDEGYITSSSSSASSEGEDYFGAQGAEQVRRNREMQASQRTKEGQKQKKDILPGRQGVGEQYRRFMVGNENYQSKGKVKKDGRLRITVNEAAHDGYLSRTLSTAMQKMAQNKEELRRTTSDHQIEPASPRSRRSSAFNLDDISPIPKLNIVIMVIGSRGDIQPFLRIGKVLKEDYGHRVRIATHPAFRDFVENDSKLEFFSVGGDPSELMAFMVKNPGLIPKLDTVKSGEIGKRRAAMAKMFDGFWRACINATDDEQDRQNLKMMGKKDPFVADAIIANPPSFAHIHCAEALGIPLHLMFTFPYTPTQAFPHPLATIKRSNVDSGYTNFISYPMVEMMVWQGLGDLVNDFRVKTLNLDPASTLWAPGATYRLHVPFTYLWSPGIVAKPEDWGPQIDISGFVYLDLASTFKPPQELEDFLNAGEPPIYIGFGSIVVDDPEEFTQLIFKAVEKAGVRAVISRGWGGLGGQDTPDNVYMLGNTPHDWLFPRMKAVVIHGGAGTTAIALKCGLPTFIVPFFGDQHFWGKMVGNSNVGPTPIPYKSLTIDNLAEGIEYCLTAEAKEAALEVAQAIERDGDGAVNACQAFHKHLNLRGQYTMRCSLLPDRIAAWKPKKTNIKLSPLAADILVDAGYMSYKRLRLIRHAEWNDFEGPGEPITGIAGSLVGTVGTAFSGVGKVPFHLVKAIKKTRRMRKGRSGQKKNNDAKSPNDKNTNGTAPGVSKAAAEAGVPAPELDRQLQVRTPLDSSEDYAGDVVQEIGQTAYAIATAPVDLSLALAQGFHNAPRLYGDDTVRRPTRITGIRSGLRAARNEFAYGVYDGVTGVVRLPIRGAKNEGAVGFIKGTGMGLMGFVIKNAGAVIGPFGYTLKGVVKQAERSKSPQLFVRRVRIAQGQRASTALPDSTYRELKKRVVGDYHIMKDLCDAIQAEAKARGFVGHMDHLLGDTGVLFETVDGAKQALASLRRGEGLENVLQPYAGRRKVKIPQFSRALNKRREETISVQHDDKDNKEQAHDGASTVEDRARAPSAVGLERSMTSRW